MARIEPVGSENTPLSVQEAFEKHVTTYNARITNMKATLGHSLLAFDVYMQWYPLYEKVKEMVGERGAYLYAWSISNASNCPLCSTFFRKIIVDAGENPEQLVLGPYEQKLLDFGSATAQHKGCIANHVYNTLSQYHNAEEMVVLIAFAGQMIATNVFNNVIETEIDTYLEPLPARKILCMSQMKDKVAFITGAAHGQGKATALALAKEGVHIIAFDLAQPLSYPGYSMGTPDELQLLKQECEALGVQCIAATGDVRVDDDIVAVVQEAQLTFKRIDILFNNAGICAYGLAHELTEREWDAMLDINLKGAWMVARRIIPLMIQQKSGVIINNSSIAGLRGMNRLSHYAASKWGLTGLTKSWAIELAPHNIRVVSIHPTGVNTPMNDGLAALEGTTPKEIAERSAGNLLDAPWIEPEDVASAVVFLASDQSRFITGSQFVLDDGLLTR